MSILITLSNYKTLLRRYPYCGECTPMVIDAQTICDQLHQAISESQLCYTIGEYCFIYKYRINFFIKYFLNFKIKLIN
jgi:hypothetical protein